MQCARVLPAWEVGGAGSTECCGFEWCRARAAAGLALMLGWYFDLFAGMFALFGLSVGYTVVGSHLQLQVVQRAAVGISWLLVTYISTCMLPWSNPEVDLFVALQGLCAS